MNTRKFILIVSIVISVFLFAAGGLTLYYINHSSASDSLLNSDSGNDESSNPLKNLINKFKSDNPVNFLVLIGDREEANTDTILLVNYNPSKSSLSALTIPRDTKVDIKNTSVSKINAAYISGGGGDKGATYAAETVSDLLDVNINYYVYFNIDTIKDIIDELGGVKFDVPEDMDYEDPVQNLYIHLKKGTQTLDGDKAEQLLRYRNHDGNKSSFYDGSDLKRTEMQQKFIKEFIKQKTTPLYLPKLSEVIKLLFKNVKTNLTLNDALKMILNVNKIRDNELKSFRLDGVDDESDYWYYEFNDKIIDLATMASLPADQVTEQYFNAQKGFVEKKAADAKASSTKQTTTKKTIVQPETETTSATTKPTTTLPDVPATPTTTAPTTTKTNPSNANTNMQGTTGVNP